MKNKSQRLSHISRDQMTSPGPGAYDANVNAIKEKVRNTTAAFGKSQRSGFVGKDERIKPGPGNYDIPDTRNNKAFKMG